MDISIRLAGAAGQGLQTMADLLGRAALRSGLWAYCYTDAESRIRGGLNFSHLRICDEQGCGVVDEHDLLVALTEAARDGHSAALAQKGTLLCASDCDDPRAAPFSLITLAEKAGSKKAVGTVALGAVCALLGIERTVVGAIVAERFKTSDDLLAVNEKALEAGFEAVREWGAGGSRKTDKPGADGTGRLLVTGHEAVALGAVAGGVRLLAGYPMSPATGIMADLAGWAGEVGLVVEQAEDEVAAINMVAGAAYAGARAMTATSGGGFCLMTEGISLLGMIEAPAVIVLGQRPGPSTGLPTRTAQGDLHLVLHAGHGFFPRVILAPGDISDAFVLTTRAFEIAERFQVPVFVLCDQLLLDGQAVIEPPAKDDLPTRRHLLDKSELEAMARYRRYEQTESGISPLAAPGTSHHTVVVDSDEHDEEGHLTESGETAARMAAKRQRKDATLGREEFCEPLLEGDPASRHLLVSWGSTFPTLSEARSLLGQRAIETAHLHLRQLWPLPAGKLDQAFRKAQSITVVENNVSGELATLLARMVSRRPDHLVKRSDGRPFNVGGLADRLEEVLR